VNTVRELFFPGVVVVVTALIGVWLSAESQAMQQASSDAAAAAIAGAWTLNKDLSDEPQADRPTDNQPSGQGGRHGGYGRGGGMGGGYGRGGGMGRGGSGGGRMDPDAAQRMRDAMHDYMTPPDRLTIVQTGNLVVITTGEGRVTRLSPDGKKIKDENTGIERKTKWDAGKLVSEVSGLGRGKIIETYALEPEHHELVVTITREGGRQPSTVKRVYLSSTSSSSMPATRNRTWVPDLPIASSARSISPRKWS
jgi:hypothetical protein